MVRHQTKAVGRRTQTYSDVCIRTDASNELLQLGGEKIASVWESSETDPAKAWDFDDNNSLIKIFFDPFQSEERNEK